MSLSRRMMLGRSLIGAAFAPFAAKAGAQSAAGSMFGAFPPPTGKQNVGYANAVAEPAWMRPFTSFWWNRHRREAEDHVLQQGWTLPLDADVTGLRSLSPMARQRIMRRRWVERDLANRTMWERARAWTAKQVEGGER